MNTDIIDREKKNKTITIIVNGRPREIPRRDRELTYLEVVQLAYPDQVPSDTLCFNVTFSNPRGKDGSLVEGQSVKAKPGMIFNVRRNDKS